MELSYCKKIWQEFVDLLNTALQIWRKTGVHPKLTFYRVL